MLTIPRTKYPRRLHDRLRPRASATPTPPQVALMLVAAEYEDSAWVRLTFDRPINIGSLNGSAITVDDGAISGTLWQGLSGMLTGPATVQIELEPYDPSGSADTLLNAGANTGIVADDDGGTWAGATNLLLPFP